jgi:diguanylate cyclase (GGDEF)-like protein
MRKFPASLRTFLHSTTFAGLLLIAASWFVAFFVSSVEREKAIDGAMKQSDSMVRLFEQNTLDTFDRIDRTLLLLRKSFEDDPVHFDLHRWAGQAAIVGAETFQLTLIGADGFQKATTLEYDGPPIYLGDRAHFQKQRAAEVDELVISEPVLGRTSKRLSLQLSRRLHNVDGSFAGLILLSIDPNFIQRFYKTVDLGAHNTLVMRSLDGVIMAAQGLPEEATGKRYVSMAMTAALAQSPAGHYWSRGTIDGENRLVAYRMPQTFPLIFTVGLSEDNILSQYQRHRTVYMLIASVATVLVLIGISFALRYQIQLTRSQQDLQRLNREISEQNVQFDAALTNMSSGLAMFDTDGRLTVWNERYDTIYRMPRELVQEGASIYAIVKFCDQIEKQNLDVVAFIDNFRRELREIGRSLTTARLKDGRIISIIMTAIEGGGFVSIHEDVTAQRAQEKLIKEKAAELEVTNARFNTALHHMSQGLCLFDPDQRVVVANARYAEIYRLREDQVRPGTALREILHARLENGTNFTIDADSYVRVNIKQSSEIQEIADGRVIAIKRQPMANGSWLTTHEDVTAERRNQKLLAEKAAELEVTNKRFSAALGNMAQGLVMFDGEKRLIVWNHRFAQLYNVPERFLKVGTPYAEIVSHRIARGLNKNSDDPEVKAKVAELTALTASASRIDELPDGRCMQLTRQPMEGGGWVAVIEDITERRRAEAEIVHLARHDTLTGLANRAEFNARLEEASQRIQRTGGAVTVMMMDLDRFKAVNDTLGHLAGDQLLTEVSQRLRGVIGKNDLLARLGGDEFAIIQQAGSEQRSEAMGLAIQIIDTIARPFDLNGHEANVGASVGIAMAPEHGVEPEDLLRHADLALYNVKSSGRNDFRLFEHEMLETANTQQSAERELREAIAEGQFELHYQPIVDIKTRQLCGVETLVRWRHPTKGMIAPDHFIPLAESTGLIRPLGEWILQRACEDAAAWPEQIKIAVNISAVQFKKGNLFDTVLRALLKTGLSAQRLELEITETSVLENREAHLNTIRQLKNLGLSIALDDFGTGFSSISYLTIFPFDKIKIDKSFTRDVLARDECKAVVASTLALAQGLGIVTTVEGVETEEQFEYMRAAGVELAQGYLFGKPMSVSDFGQANATMLMALVA